VSASIPPTGPPDPICAVCSKSIGSGELVVYEQGAFSHVRCHSKVVRLRAIEDVAHSQKTRERADQVVFDSRSGSLEHPRPTLRSTGESCPFCGGRATVTDWRPSVDWLVIEGCPCDGYFLWAGLSKGLLTQLSRETRARLALRIRGLRGSGREAWCMTEDGTETGLLIVRAERPDRAM
jgi:hypothetical protein